MERALCQQCPELAVSGVGRKSALVSEVAVGRGRLILCGNYLGEAYSRNPGPGFERFVEHVARGSGWDPEVEVASAQPDEHFVYVKYGEAAGRRVLFAFFPAGQDRVHLRFRGRFFGSAALRNIIADRDIPISPTETGHGCVLAAPAWRFSVLKEL